jgi:hypothetical protein
MAQVDAKCLDVQVNRIGPTMDRSAQWAVRALLEYDYDGDSWQSTPMPHGYAVFVKEEAAEDFASRLKNGELVRLYVDKKRPMRSLFVEM